jgi:hypothetical protein
VRRLLLFPLLFAACSSSEPQVSEEQVVIGTARPAGKPKQTSEWFEGQIAAAWDDLQAGRLEEGLKRVVHARAQHPEGEDLTELDDLLQRLNRAVLDLPTLTIAIEPERDPIVFGEPVRIRVRISNPGPRRVRVRAKPPKGSPTIFVLDVQRTEHDIRAQVVQSRLQVHHPLRKDLDLPPRATTEIVFTVAGAGNDRPLDGFRTFTVGGQLRAGSIELDGLRRYEGVRMHAGTVRSFRANWEHLAGDPVARVRQAFERSAPLHLLTAVALVPKGARGAAVDALVAGLTGAGPMDLCAFGCLEYLTNVELGRDADAWRAWWARVRDRFFAEEGGASGDREKPKFAVPR